MTAWAFSVAFNLQLTFIIRALQPSSLCTNTYFRSIKLDNVRFRQICFLKIGWTVITIRNFWNASAWGSSHFSWFFITSFVISERGAAISENLGINDLWNRASPSNGHTCVAATLSGHSLSILSPTKWPRHPAYPIKYLPGLTLKFAFSSLLSDNLRNSRCRSNMAVNITISSTKLSMLSRFFRNFRMNLLHATCAVTNPNGSTVNWNNLMCALIAVYCFELLVNGICQYPFERYNFWNVLCYVLMSDKDCVHTWYGLSIKDCDLVKGTDI